MGSHTVICPFHSHKCECAHIHTCIIVCEDAHRCNSFDTCYVVSRKVTSLVSWIVNVAFLCNVPFLFALCMSCPFSILVSQLVLAAKYKRLQRTCRKAKYTGELGHYDIKLISTLLQKNNLNCICLLKL